MTTGGSTTFTAGGGGSTAEGITPTGRFETFSTAVGGGLNFDNQAVATGVENGEELILLNTGAQTITFFGNGTTQLRLGAASRAVAGGGSLHLMWSTALGYWVEIAFTASTV